ncbi:MAG: DUF4382 domain-containing protein, partial [Terriglobales bacterium]
MRQSAIGVLVGVLVIVCAGCGGLGPVAGAAGARDAQAAAATSQATTPVFLTLGALPAPGVLSAQITLGSVEAVKQDGSATELLAEPATVELMHLGLTRTLLAEAGLAEGTYRGFRITITGAQITYRNPVNGQIAFATSTPAAGTSASLLLPEAGQSLGADFNAPVAAGAGGALQMHIEFDLGRSLELSSGQVTFVPSVTGADPSARTTLAAVGSESAYATAVDVSGTVDSLDLVRGRLEAATASGFVATVETSGATLYSGGLSLSNLQTGAAVRIHTDMQEDGTLEATSLETADNGAFGASGSADEGVVIAAAAPAFAMVVQESTNRALVGQVMTVTVSPGAVYQAALAATAAGQPADAFNAGQIFVGQEVWVAGSSAEEAGANPA